MSNERVERLQGGFQTDVLRIGGTVRRPVRPWTPAVHALLCHLEGVGFGGAPRALGIDDQGREILTYVEGEPASGAPLPGYVWSEATLEAVGRMLRALHDATRTFVAPPEATWQLWSGTGHGEVVCHNDAAPWNTVFRDGAPVAFIDWDSASPGAALWDLAYAAWQWIPLWEDRRALDHGFSALETRASRLSLLCRAYGVTPSERPNILDVIEQRIMWQREYIVRSAQAGSGAGARLVELGAVEGVGSDLAMVRRHRGELARALLLPDGGADTCK